MTKLPLTDVTPYGHLDLDGVEPEYGVDEQDEVADRNPAHQHDHGIVVCSPVPYDRQKG